MRRILVFQHVATEPLGHLDPLLRASGIRIRYVNFGREPHAQPDVRGYDALLVLGGPMNVDQADHLPHLRYEMGAIHDMVRQDRPVLGICLGAQLLAAAMGGDVRPNPVPEIGWYQLHTRPAAHDDRLLRHFERRPQFVFQWHAYTFAPPPGATPLAWTRNCRNQAYRLGDHAWGLQFHLEADEALIERWLTLPGGRDEIERHWNARRIARIRAGNRRHLSAAETLSERVFGEFVRMFPRRRYATLSSR
ncbi:MAG: gamma-glutamyl-gamma-aminobutyrate hydrolase family protein [Burkholderiaceae bacterium]|jgi:GMP synthase (glutamine-hydrolysing)|nr:gamma-glutamyl-gamma-aminobutyrate hydrolase family protein [Burkholderiaceae bacterium]